MLAARRGESMAMPLKWEFPGGKIKSGETPEDCLRREIAEELNVSIAVHQSLAPVTHAYPAFTITLYPFICSIAAGDIKPRGHAAVAWLPRNQLFTLDWAEADLPVVLNAASALNGRMAMPSMSLLLIIIEVKK